MFGSFLAQIASPASLALLEHWRRTESSAGTLHDLAVAVKNSGVQSFYRKITDKVPVKKQFSKGLRDHYLIALLVERLPPIEADKQDWFEHLRMWVLTHAFERSSWGIIQDGHLHFISARLLMASGTSQVWRETFLLARPSSVPQDFDTLNHYIIYKCELLLAKAEQLSLSEVRRNLLRNLISVASYVQSREPIAEHLPFFIQRLIVSYAENSAQPHAPVLETLSEDEGVANAGTEWQEDDPETEESFIIQASVDENLSYAQQALEAGKIFLSAAEELQFLPWSWRKPNSYELLKLDKWIEQNGVSTGEGDRVLAADVWISLHTGNSLRRALDIPFSKAARSDWTIHPDTLALQRLPPQRLPGWQPKGEQANWVNPVADKLVLSLPRPLAMIIKKCYAKHSDPKLLGDLWNKKWGNSQEEHFRNTAGKAIPRLTPGIMNGALFQNICTASGDPVLARLFSSHPNSALSGACSYPGWNFSQLRPVMEKVAPGFSVSPSAESRANAVGSRLDPIENLLADGIRKATAILKNLHHETDPIKFHNIYTAYITVMLLAATGGRPVNDPFEKLGHFDFSDRFVYIEDKASGAGQRGRLVPLFAEICQFVSLRYLAHLANLASAIRDANPGLADGILGIASGNSTGAMPFLFFLAEGVAGWKSVSEKAIGEIGIFDWPLPLNLFRHRLSRKLRHMGADTELIDAVMGHVEAATPTHGDYSFRIWKEDMDAVRPLMEKLFGELPFELLPGWSGASRVRAEPGKQDVVPSTGRAALFGAQARSAERKLNFIGAVRDAARQIKMFLAGRQLSDLDKDELHELSEQLLFKKGRMLHPRGHIKYRYLVRQAERLWRREGKKCRFKKRYVMAREEASSFRDSAPGAIGLFRELHAALVGIAPGMRAGKLGYMAAADAATAFLCLENGVASKRLLEDVLERKNFRLVTINGRAYLEYSRYFISVAADAPVQRFLLSKYSARLLDRFLGGVTRKFKDHPVPGLLQPLVEVLVRHRKIGPDAPFLKFLAALCGIADQVNVMTMPGIVAGYLAGRVESYSPMWRDFTRLELGYVTETPFAEGGDTPDGEKSTAPQWRTPFAAWQPTGADNSLLQQETAHSLLDRIKKTLKEYIDKKSGPYAVNDRKEMKRRFLSMVDDSEHVGRVSPAIQLLVLWGCSLLTRKKGDGFIQISTIGRYLDALIPPFEKIGHSADMLAMDDDDITHFYTQLIESLEVDDTQYVADRLSDFHGWARREFTIEEPDWLEIPATFSTAHVRPGIVVEDDYQLALKILLGREGRAQRERLAPAFLLLLCYRFGLRGNEALGLGRADWQDFGDLVVVCVQGNALRRLKTPTSRRQVPLLFSLSDQEKEIIGQWAVGVEAQLGQDMSAGLFFKDKSAWNNSEVHRIKSAAIAALKAATGNPLCTLHHARHAAANRVGIGVCCDEMPGWGLLSGDRSLPPSSMKTVLLGSTGPTRRKIWALGGYLGHVRKETTTRNYVHFIGDIANKRMMPTSGGAPGNLLHAIDLGAFPKLVPVSAGLLAPPAPAAATPAMLLAFFRLVSTGKPPEVAARALGFDAKLAVACHSLLCRLDRKVRLNVTKLTKGKEELAPLEFLRRIKALAWTRLFGLAKSAGDCRAGAAAPPAITLDGIEGMVGATQQLVLWEPEHFRLARLFLKSFVIPDSRIRVIRSDQADDRIMRFAEESGFKPVGRSEAGAGENKARLDAAAEGENQNRVEKRCALLLIGNREFALRNNIELIAAFLAFAVARLQPDNNC